MKESILDVLLYLFEHYFTEDADLVRDRDSLQSGLLQAGFSPAETSKAFDWLDALAAQRPSAAIRRVDGPTRVYFGPALDKPDRSEEPRVGKECVSTGSFRGWAYT